jgi:hydroxyethylthiazole kinase
MADCEKEVAEIATMADALYLNIGTANEAIINNMLKAGKAANAAGKPIVLDPVGIGASTFRRESVRKLLCELKISAIRGNASEIKAIAAGTTSTRGVDADEGDKIEDASLDRTIQQAKTLASKLGCIIAISGKIDIVSDGVRTAILRNGDAMMSSITGTGCMVTAVIAAYLASGNDPFGATLTAITQMNVAGEIAKELSDEGEGNASYGIHLIDSIGLIDEKVLNRRAHYEIIG